MSIDRNQFQAFEPDLEAKAFIYQQVQELEDQLKSLGGMTVYVEKEEVVNSSTDEILENNFAVTFIVDPENLNLKVRAESKNLYSACLSAKDVTKSKLVQLMNHRQADDHAQRVSDALEQKGWLH